MNRKTFEQLVLEAITSLPERAKIVMENIAFVIEGEARRKKTTEMGISMDEVLLGLYEGIPKTKRGANYFGVLPDKITIFQKPIEELAGRNKERLKKMIYAVVWHEVGHHVGLEEAELRALEVKKRKNI